MAIAFGASGARYVTGATGVTAWPVAYPAGVSAGDLLVCLVVTNGAPVSTPPAGWTAIADDNTQANPKMAFYYKVAAGGESGTLTFNISANTTTAMQGCAQMHRYTGADPSPVDVGPSSVDNTVAATTVVIPSLTTTAAGDLLLYFAAVNSGSTTMTGPGTERSDYAQAGGTGTKAGAVYEEILGAAGATGTRTINLSASRTGMGAMVAFKAASGGSSPQTVNPGAVGLSAGRGTPTLAAVASAVPSGVSLTAGRGTPVASSVAVTTPSGKALTAGRGTPTLGTAALTAPQGVSLTAVEGAPAVSAAATSNPTGVGLSAVEGTPSIVTANSPQTAAPGGVGLAAAEGTPGVSTAALTGPGGVQLVAGEGSPGVSTAVLVTPAGVQLQAAEGGPVVGTSITAHPAGKALAASPAAPAGSTATTAEPEGAGATTAAGTPDLSTGLTAAPDGFMLVLFAGEPVAAVSQDQEVNPEGVNTAIIPGTPGLAALFRAVIGIIVEDGRWKASAGGPRYYTEDDDPARAAASTTHQPPAADPGTRWDTR